MPLIISGLSLDNGTSYATPESIDRAMSAYTNSFDEIKKGMNDALVDSQKNSNSSQAYVNEVIESFKTAKDAYAKGQISVEEMAMVYAYVRAFSTIKLRIDTEKVVDAANRLTNEYNKLADAYSDLNKALIKQQQAMDDYLLSLKQYRKMQEEYKANLSGELEKAISNVKIVNYNGNEVTVTDGAGNVIEHITLPTIPNNTQGTGKDTTLDPNNLLDTNKLFSMSATDRINLIANIANNFESTSDLEKAIVKAYSAGLIIISEPQKIIENINAAFNYQYNLGTNYSDPEMSQAYADVMTFYITGKVLEGVNSAFKGTIKTPAQIANSSPIKIPSSANIVEQTKTGYNQIKYTWSDGTYKFEARWHTRTPGAPAGQGDTWVVTRTTPGNATGQQKVQHIMTGENQWTPMKQWQDAVTARQNGTATLQQQQLLDSGHWPVP